MRYEVKMAVEAEADFLRIGEYLVKNDFDFGIALTIRKDIYRKLSDKPRNNPHLDNGIYKMLVLRKNVVYYEIRENTVTVLRIRAGGMNVEL